MRKNSKSKVSKISLAGGDKDLERISATLGIALSVQELKRIRDYFARRGRDPTDVELEALGQAWSEHCCYKSSKPALQQYIYGKTPQVLLVEDAGVVALNEEYAYVLALESHNHPSAIEPYGGAATGVGGIVRDVLCMGARPIALIDSLFFGSLSTEDLPRGVRHPRYLLDGVVSGISDYGNRLGIPTIAGSIRFDDGYVGNCVVNVGCLGIVRRDGVVRSAIKRPGDELVLVGGKTGRDGIHGVTFASTELGPQTGRSAVQLGNPIVEEPLIHACLEATSAIDGMKDLGGGGLSCVVGEMAFAGGVGAEISLDRVPLKEEGMAPWEIWVSESQERMLLAVDPKNRANVLEIFDYWDVPATVIGRATEDKMLKILYEGELIFDMDIDFLVNGPVYRRPYTLPSKKGEEVTLDEPGDYNALLLQMLASPEGGSRAGVIRQYDYEVRGQTVIKPLQGAFSEGCYTHGDAPVIKPLEDSYVGLAIGVGLPLGTQLDPFWGSASAVDEACRNLVAVGARPHVFADCLNFGSPERSEQMGSFWECCKGLSHVARALEIPFVSGNVSFYNEWTGISIPPTPLIIGVGIVPDIRRCRTVEFKHSGDLVYLVGETKEELGGSLYYKIRGVKGGRVPRVDVEALKRGIENLDGIVACHDVSEGGVGIALAEMAIGSNLGARVSLPKDMRLDCLLFSESNTRWLCEVPPAKMAEFEGLPLYKERLGVVGGSKLVINDRIDLSVGEMRGAWESWAGR